MDRRTVKLLQQFFGPSWSEDKWQADPGEMLSLEKGTSKGTALLHLFAEGNNFQLSSANLNQNFSACQSVQVWFLPSVDILWYRLFFSSFCTYFFLFSQSGAQAPISPGSFYFSFIHSTQVLSLHINYIFSFILILTWEFNGGKIHFKPTKLYCLFIAVV